jgi:multiple sugar transport system substrate-binding protein
MTGSARFRGITWSHPRGYVPLEALADHARGDGDLAVKRSTVTWDRQSLSGFESHPIADLARRYELIVLDHPGLGDAVATDALASLGDLLPAAELAAWRTGTVGASFESYQYLGRQWAVPIDAATQVCAVRPDLVADVDIPSTWDEALSLAQEVAVCVPTRRPHTLLTFLGIAAAVDRYFEPDTRRLVPTDIARVALDLLARALDATPPHLLDLDPIQILDRMRVERIGCCPLVYGYVTYSGDQLGGHRVRFVDAPSLTVGEAPGTVLGGTGLALSRHAAADPRVLDHVRQVMDTRAQRRVIPDAGGQPSAVAAWEAAEVNLRWLDFYAATRRSIEQAWRRPRFPGWIRAQSDGSDLLLEGLRQGRAHGELLDDLDALYRAHRAPGYPN